MVCQETCGKKLPYRKQLNDIFCHVWRTWALIKELITKAHSFRTWQTRHHSVSSIFMLKFYTIIKAELPHPVYTHAFTALRWVFFKYLLWFEPTKVSTKKRGMYNVQVVTVEQLAWFLYFGAFATRTVCQTNFLV